MNKLPMKVKHPGGRPTKYRVEYLQLAFKFCVLGATDNELAEFLGVSESTLNLWKLKHPEFCLSLKRAKMIADVKVAEALYKRAIGYSHSETHVASYQGKFIFTELVKHYPPDVKAQIFWLRNRQPDLWGR
jgi:hypothetical protein